MIVFLVCVLVAVAFACLGLVAWVVRQAHRSDEANREERAYLMNAVLAKHGTEFRAMTVPAATTTPAPNELWDSLETQIAI